MDLSWSGATGSNVDIYRNGMVVAMTGSDGFYTDSPGGRGHGSSPIKFAKQVPKPVLIKRR